MCSRACRIPSVAVEPHDCAGPAVPDVTMFGSLSRPGEPRLLLPPNLQFNFSNSLTRPSSRGADATKRSRIFSMVRLDCFASLAMTQQSTSPHPRDANTPELYFSFRPKRAWGMPGGQRTRSLAWKIENTRVSHHGRAGITRHSRTRMVLTGSFVLAPETGLCCLRRRPQCEALSPT
jgi:hypothetical protein